VLLKLNFRVYVFAFIILILSGVFVVRSAAFTCWDFRNNLWGPTYLLTHGQSPYRVDQLFDLGNAVWMPMVVGLFFPLGFLPLQQASNLWFMFNIVWLLVIAWISSGSFRPSLFLFATALLLILLFPPLVNHLWSGQISILITFTFLMIAIWNDRMPVMLLAALMAIGLSKPQLAILVLPGFLTWQLKKYGVRRAIELVAYLAVCIFMLTIPLFVADKNWFTDFILALQKNPTWAQPSSLYFLRNEMSHPGVMIWILLAILIFAMNIWLWVSLPVRDAMYWSLALTLLITPYIWTWDFVLVLPLFISSMFKAKTKLSLGILLAGYLICWSLITSMKIRGQVNDALFWWVPWLLILFIVGSESIKAPLRLKES
jgi:hypothetical protein